jgi:hypothetical protein
MDGHQALLTSRITFFVMFYNQIDYIIGVIRLAGVQVSGFVTKMVINGGFGYFIKFTFRTSQAP